ncbi:21135_t:CDS:1, partial [Racocetra persica]
CDIELEDFMNSFITKYVPRKKTYIFKKNVRIQDDESKTISSCSSSNDDFIAVEDLIVFAKKETPRKSD